jgi:hypothetical protein
MKETKMTEHFQSNQDLELKLREVASQMGTVQYDPERAKTIAEANRAERAALLVEEGWVESSRFMLTAQWVRSDANAELVPETAFGRIDSSQLPIMGEHGFRPAFAVDAVGGVEDFEFVKLTLFDWWRVIRVEAVDITYTNIKFNQERQRAIAYLPSILFRKTLVTHQLVRAEAAITLIYRANGALELDDLFGPSSVESDTQVKTQSNEGNNQAR